MGSRELADSERRYRRLLLTLLAVIFAFSIADRAAFGLVLQDIKQAFQLSDTALGLLSGIAFALFYSTLGIPIARWADRGNRITIIGLTTCLWSLMVTLLGTARSFAELIIARIGVAVGEAGCVPPAFSLISDYFPRDERPRAISIYLLGTPLSFLIGYFAAGWISQVYGWRRMFALMGVPGLVLGIMAWVLLREPRVRRLLPPGGTNQERAQGVLQLTKALWSNKTFRHLLAMQCINYFFGNGIVQWQPAFFIRSYALKTGSLGTWLALVYCVGGVVGTYGGGYLATRYAAANERLQLQVMAILNAIFGVVYALIYISTNLYISFGLMLLATIGGSLVQGPLWATIQTVTRDNMKATSTAVVYLFANLIGMGLGPLAVGIISDSLRPWAGNDSLRYALVAMCPGYVWGGWQLWLGARTVIEDSDSAGREPEYARTYHGRTYHGRT